MNTPIPNQPETGVSAKRYELYHYDGASGHCRAEMTVSPKGDWVSYEDYERELAAQTRRVEELERTLSQGGDDHESRFGVYDSPLVPSEPAPGAEGLREAITACTAAHENKYNWAIPHASDLDDAILSAVAPFVGTEDGELLDWLENWLVSIGRLTAPDMSGIRFSGQYHNPAKARGEAGPSYLRLQGQTLRAAIRAARQSAQGGGK